MSQPVTVFVHTPSEKDASLLGIVLRQNHHPTRRIESLEDLDERLQLHDGILVCTQEGLTHGVRKRLETLIGTQPPWANLPLIIIIDQHIGTEQVQSELRTLFRGGRVILLHRPLRALEFATAVDTAVAARLKQIEVRDSLHHQRELQRELNHRVKNMMATFMAIYQITLRQSSSLPEFSTRFEGRVRALSAVHDLLQDTRDGERSIEAICHEVLAPYRQGDESRITLGGPGVGLTRTPAMSLGLILNELATNAIKYGALSRAEGSIDIHWQWTDESERTLRLVWQEQGGPPTVGPVQSGYGTRFMDASARELGGEARRIFGEAGLKFSLSMSATALRTDR